MVAKIFVMVSTSWRDEGHEKWLAGLRRDTMVMMRHFLPIE